MQLEKASGREMTHRDVLTSGNKPGVGMWSVGWGGSAACPAAGPSLPFLGGHQEKG